MLSFGRDIQATHKTSCGILIFQRNRIFEFRPEILFT